MDFNTFDVIVIIITLLLAIKGFFSGLVKEIAGLVGIGAGLFFAGLYYTNAGEYINASILKIPNQSAINLVGFVSVFVGTWLISILIGMLVAKMLQVSHLGILDRVGGVVFSAGKFFIIVSVIVTMLSQIEMFKSTLEKYQKDSVMWPIMNGVGETLIHLKPEDVKKQIDEVKNKVNESVGKQLTQAVETAKQNITENVNEQVKKVIEKTQGE